MGEFNKISRFTKMPVYLHINAIQILKLHVHTQFLTLHKSQMQLDAGLQHPLGSAELSNTTTRQIAKKIKIWKHI